MDRGYRELPFLVFNNSQELNDFTNFLKNNMKLLEGIEVNFQFNISDPMNYKRSIDLETFFKVKKFMIYMKWDIMINKTFAIYYFQ